MKKVMTRQEVSDLLSDMVRREGSQIKVAEKIQVAPSYLSQVIRGAATPGPKILEYFNLEVVYRMRGDA